MSNSARIPFKREFRRVLLRRSRALSKGRSSRRKECRRAQLHPRVPPRGLVSGFSHNGEDVIIDVLTRRIARPNRYFIENFSQAREYKMDWRGQFDLIRHRELFEIQ